MFGKPGLLSILLLIAATDRNFAQSAPRSDAEVQQAVDSLLKKMTTEEKIGQLSQLFVFDAGETVEKSGARRRQQKKPAPLVSAGPLLPCWTLHAIRAGAAWLKVRERILILVQPW